MKQFLKYISPFNNRTEMPILLSAQLCLLFRIGHHCLQVRQFMELSVSLTLF